MATDAQIRAAAQAATDLGVTPSQIIALIDRAIAEALINGLPTVSYSIGGRSVTKGLAEAQALRAYYAKLAGGGGVIAQGVEF